MIDSKQIQLLEERDSFYFISGLLTEMIDDEGVDVIMKSEPEKFFFDSNPVLFVDQTSFVEICSSSLEYEDRNVNISISGAVESLAHEKKTFSLKFSMTCENTNSLNFTKRLTEQKKRKISCSTSRASASIHDALFELRVYSSTSSTEKYLGSGRGFLVFESNQNFMMDEEYDT
jgi:hypothetical protein